MTPGRKTAGSGQGSATPPRLGALSAPPRLCTSAPLPSPRASRLSAQGFTLIEILIVITIIGILITLAQPSFNRAVTAAKEVTLKENLFILRDVIDQFYADNTKYPAALNELVEKGYIRQVPKDPITGSAESWVIVPATDEQGQQVGVYDVKSGSDRTASDGSRYNEW
jgi:general secretion pathway protein G